MVSIQPHLTRFTDTKIVVQLTCDPVDGVVRCNDDNHNCYGATSRTPWAPLIGGVAYRVLLGYA
jgi:hypothetical protein